jgi:hypothetical protein
MIGDFIGDEPSHNISKQVLEDTNNVYGSDVEIGGATVQLKDPNGTVVMPTMTACNANFTLNASPPGMYRYTIVKQTPPGFLKCWQQHNFCKYKCCKCFEHSFR